MKKIHLIICIMASVILAACTQKKQEPAEKVQKTLVAYFSASGTTRSAALQLADVTRADLYEIEPEVAYTDEDLDWRDSLSRASREMADSTSRPAIKGTISNLDDYNVVFIGYPIWFYSTPTIINTFIEANDLKGKTLIPFCTSNSSSIRKSAEGLKNTYPELNWKEGKLMNGISPKDLEAWVKEIDIDQE